MAWSPLAANQWVSANDLQDAVTTGVFTLKAAQTIPATNEWVTRAEVETWINATVTSGTSSQWPQKSWIIPVSYLSFPYMVSSNNRECTYNFATTVYRAPSDTGFFYSDTALTTLPPAGFVLHAGNYEIYKLNASGGQVGQPLFILNHPTFSINFTTTSGGTSTSGVPSLYNSPFGNYKVVFTVTSSDNPSLGWNIKLTNGVTLATISTSSNSTATVGNSLTLNFNTSVCESLAVSAEPVINPPVTNSTITFDVQYLPQ